MKEALQVLGGMTVTLVICAAFAYLTLAGA